MSRVRPGGGYDHNCRRVAADTYIISWYWDRYYSGQRCRYPQAIERWTDEKGARRFCRKWDCRFPEPPEG